MRIVAISVIAHQGGWDEALLIGGPIVAIAGLLMLAKKRVDAAAAELAAEPPAEGVTDSRDHVDVDSGN